MREKSLGRLKVSAQGLGCSHLTGNYGTEFNERVAAATLDRAFELGVQLLDTSDMYGPHTNEEFIGRVIRDRRQQVMLATKFGTLGAGGLQAPGSTPAAMVRGDADYARQACEGSLRRLGVECIDLYYLHRVDPKVPIEETVGAMADLVASGKVRFLGLSEVSSETLRRAAKVHPISALESEWSLWSRDIETEIVATARELGAGIVPYAPLGRGFLTGRIKSEGDFGPTDGRRHNPRFQGDNFKKNLDLVRRIGGIAQEKGCTPAQLALAWLDSRGADVVPIPGGDRPEYVEENVGALEVHLTATDLRRIDQICPRGIAAGQRYADMSWVMGGTPRQRTVQ